MDYILNLPLSTLPIPETPNGTMALWHYGTMCTLRCLFPAYT